MIGKGTLQKVPFHVDALLWLVFERGLPSVGQHGVDLGLKFLLDARVSGQVVEYPGEGGGGSLIAGKEQIQHQNGQIPLCYRNSRVGDCVDSYSLSSILLFL